MSAMVLSPELLLPIRLDLARALMAHLGARPYAEVAVLANALGGVLWVWEAKMREELSSTTDEPAEPGASSAQATGHSSDNGDKTTGPVSPTAEPVPTHGPTDVPGVPPRPNGRADA